MRSWITGALKMASCEVHDPALPALVEAGTRIGQVVPGEGRRLGDQIRTEHPLRLPITLEQDLALLGDSLRMAGEKQLLGLILVRHDLELEEARGLQDVLGDLLDPRDLDEDAVLSLAGDDGLGNPGGRVVDASAQDLERLAHAGLPHLLLPVRRELQGQAVLAALRDSQDVEVREHTSGGGEIGLAAELDHDAGRLDDQALGRDALVLQLGLQGAPQVVELLFHGCPELGAEDPVDATAQIEPQPHASVRKQRTLLADFLGREVCGRQVGEQSPQSADQKESPAQAHASSPFPTRRSTRARSSFTRTRSPFTFAISTVRTSSVAPVTVPCRPPEVTMRSPFSTDLSSVSCSRWRFCCGRIRRK
jgi:hypothetical protein